MFMLGWRVKDLFSDVGNWNWNIPAIMGPNYSLTPPCGVSPSPLHGEDVTVA